MSCSRKIETLKRVIKLAAALAVLVVLVVPTGAVAQNKYDTFVGNWMASVLIANSCQGMRSFDEQTAAGIAKSQDKLRKQKVLKLMFYGKTTWLEQQGNAALAGRNLNPSNTKSLCAFGKGVAGKNDSIGRFLHLN